MDSQRLEFILSRYECDPWDLIPVLQDIQDGIYHICRCALVPPG